MQGFFLALLSIEAVLIGAAFALLMAFVQMVAGRFSPTIAYLALCERVIGYVFLVFFATLMFIAAVAVIITAIPPPRGLSFIPPSHTLQRQIVASVGAAGVVLSVVLGVGVVWMVSSYLDGRTTALRLSNDLTFASAGAATYRGRNSLWLRILSVVRGAPTFEPMQPFIELTQQAMRDGDRVLHAVVITDVLDACVQWINAGAPAREAVALVVERFLKPASGLAADPEPSGFSANMAKACIELVGKLPDPAIAEAEPLIDLSRDITTSLILRGADSEAGAVITEQWRVCRLALGNLVPPAQIGVQFLNMMGNIGLITMSAAPAISVASGTATLRPSVEWYSQAIRFWRVGAGEALKAGEIPTGWLPTVVVSVITALQPLIPRTKESEPLADELRALLVSLAASISRLAVLQHRDVLVEFDRLGVDLQKAGVASKSLCRPAADLCGQVRQALLGILVESLARHASARHASS